MNSVHHIPYTNNTSKPVNVGGKHILPGETRPVDARFVPAKPEVNSQLKLWYVNLSDSAQHFGNTTVNPKASARLPANHFVNPNTPANTAQTDVFLQLLALPVTTINTYLSELTPDELLALKNLEQTQGQKRKSLLEDIEKEITHQKNVSEFAPAVYVKHLKSLSNEALELEVLNVKNDSAKTALVDAERAARAK